MTELAPCARLKHIEARLTLGDTVSEADARWMIGQIRGWQNFAKRVVDFGDVLRAQSVSETVLQGFDRVFKAEKKDG